MKILQIVPYCLPYHGGQERYVYNLSKYLVRHGHDVEIITSNYPYSQEYETSEGIRITRHRCLARPMRNPLTPAFMTLARESRECDIVHTHNEHSTAAMAAAFLRNGRCAPLILTCHGQLIFGDNFRDTLEKIYSKTIGRGIFSRVDRIAVNSADDRDYVLSINASVSDKIDILHNAIDPEFFDAVRGANGNFDLSGRTNLLYVGRLIRRKGLEWLIRAMAIIKHSGNGRDVRCILVGEGEDREYFERLIRELGVEGSVVLAGDVGLDELVYLYRHADLFVLPSLSEVCPTVVLEAMYFGLPVVTTDIPGVRDHFAGSALLVPPKDEVALARAVQTVIDDKNTAVGLARAGQDLVTRKYLWSRVSKAYESIYRSMGA
ncbi:glycosyltransferase family 4 protein [Methanofollis sp. UBA420]|jgi:glycosyltransferase involved in cell wall biosynthesis|uniref:glycosyltransferase family 4 protein n=1 Tax=Methanofollis sp. UBA420 TaxID=1915514 RepID=UPI00316ACCCE